MKSLKKLLFLRKTVPFAVLRRKRKNFEKIENNACIFRSYVVSYQSRQESGKQNIRVWRSLVSRLNGVQEASSSNLDTRTKSSGFLSKMVENRNFFLYQKLQSLPKKFCYCLSIAYVTLPQSCGVSEFFLIHLYFLLLIYVNMDIAHPIRRLATFAILEINSALVGFPFSDLIVFPK